MKYWETEHHAEWEIGEYTIRHDKRHGCFDVARGNGHFLCVNSFKTAMSRVLQAQGWGSTDEAVEKVMTTFVKMEDWENPRHLGCSVPVAPPEVGPTFRN